ncbi:MAG TPA: ribonuclease Z [Parasegetibacter sp.]
MFGVTILGNNSALPAFDRHPTSQVVTMMDQRFLIDCGEGTQMQLARYKVRHSKISRIFISHLHGDHYFGLIGLLTSMGLLNREQELFLYAPPALIEIIQLQLKVADTTLPYALHFHPITEEGILIDEEKFSVSCFRVVHRIECWGFVFREKRNPRKINKDKAEKYGIPARFYDELKKGKDYVNDSGEIISNEAVTIPGIPAKSYGYCADTLYEPRVAEKVKNVNLLYHETTYLGDLAERAASRFHSTTKQAADIARLSNAGRLLIGHFSSKYECLDQFLSEAREVFPETQLALEGVTFLV